ncbi:Ciliogenesis and planar polarity effector 1, partial [Dissostichus eleginoides]
CNSPPLMDFKGKEGRHPSLLHVSVPQLPSQSLPQSHSQALISDCEEVSCIGSVCVRG